MKSKLPYGTLLISAVLNMGCTPHCPIGHGERNRD